MNDRVIKRERKRRYFILFFLIFFGLHPPTLALLILHFFFYGLEFSSPTHSNRISNIHSINYSLDFVIFSNLTLANLTPLFLQKGPRNKT